MRDVTGGFRAHTAESLRRLDLSSVEANGYGFQIGLSFRTVRRGGTVREVPIDFGERFLGESKMSGAIVVEAFALVARLALRGDAI
jgi:dolichol-phosphate mannosyltransferase